MTIDLTGPYAIVTPDIFEGIVDYYRYVNEELGGVNGHPVELVWGETGNIMSRAWSHYKRFKDAGAQLLIIASSPEGEAFKAPRNGRRKRLTGGRFPGRPTGR